MIVNPRMNHRLSRFVAFALVAMGVVMAPLAIDLSAADENGNRAVKARPATLQPAIPARVAPPKKLGELLQALPDLAKRREAARVARSDLIKAAKAAKTAADLQNIKKLAEKFEAATKALELLEKKMRNSPHTNRVPPGTVLQGYPRSSAKEDESKSLTVTLKDKTLPCGVGRVKKNGTWNEPYRYVFHTFPDYLAKAHHIFMRQNGGGAVGRWFDTGQVEVSKPCWFFAAVYRPSDTQREIWKKEGWQILPEVLKDLGDLRTKPRPVREYMLMRKSIAAGPINFDTSAQKTMMVIWMFQELEQPNPTSKSPSSGSR